MQGCHPINNVEVDGRGSVYIADRASTSLHVLELTGAARHIVQLQKDASDANH